MLDEKFGYLARIIVQRLSPEEALSLENWFRSLLEIRNGSSSNLQKARSAIDLTVKSHVIWPVIKSIARTLQSIGWTQRSWAGRLGLSGAAAGLAVFGTQGAGIAALGTAIGVPLWVVIGSGSAFAGVVIEELNRNRQNRND